MILFFNSNVKQMMHEHVLLKEFIDVAMQHNYFLFIENQSVCSFFFFCLAPSSWKAFPRLGGYQLVEVPIKAKHVLNKSKFCRVKIMFVAKHIEFLFYLFIFVVFCKTKNKLLHRKVLIPKSVPFYCWGEVPP